MASPQSANQSKGKKKGKQKKAASAEDGGPSTSASTESKPSPPGPDGLKNRPGPTNVADTSLTSHTDKQQNKQEKKSKQQSKPPSQQEGAKGGDAAGGAGADGAGGEGEGEKPKSKAQLKAERRAIQERQRALKEAKKAEASGGGGGGGAAASGSGSGAGGPVAGKKESGAAGTKKEKGGPGGDQARQGGAGQADSGATSRSSKKSSTKLDYRGLSEEECWQLKEKDVLQRGFKMDEAIFRLGLQYFHHRVVGGNARCVALLTTLKEVIAKYKTPEEKELSRDLEKNFLAPCITFLTECRPLSTSMGNAIKFLKQQINQIPQGTEDTKAIGILQDAIDNFIYDNITKAAEAVALYANQKIDDGDVILIYAASSLIGQVLKFAHDKGKQFRVIVVEGRPRTEGRTMLRYLVRCGIRCSYIYIGSASHAMKETTKVFLGASAMFAIGDMHSRTGNAMLAAVARANNIPVLVCCETYKFTDKVLLPGLSTQQARGKDLMTVGHRPPSIPQYQDLELKLLNNLYDVTQSRYITALVTELGMVPCTSVPVVLRRQEDRNL